MLPLFNVLTATDYENKDDNEWLHHREIIFV